jgi:hypothetical protein
MSSLITTRLSSRPRRDRSTSHGRSPARATPSGRLLRFPFVIAALIVMVIAGFVLFDGTSHDQTVGVPSADPWRDVPHVTERVPATPSRGAMGLPG